MRMPELKQPIVVRVLCCVALIGLGIGIFSIVPVHVAFAADAAKVSDFVTPQLEVAIPGVNLSSGQVSVQKDSIQIGFLGAYINGVYNFLLGIVVITAAVMIVYGGFKYIIAATGAGIQDGKERIKDAVLGLILVFASSTLLKVMNPSLGTLKPLTVQTVDLEYYSAIQHGDQPPSQYARAAAEASTDSTGNNVGAGAGVGGAGESGVGAGVGGSGGSSSSPQQQSGGLAGIDFSLNKNQGCGPNGYTEVKALCASVQDCYNKYCLPQPHMDPKPAGLIEAEKSLITFKDLPKDKKQQIEQYGLKLMLDPPAITVTQEAHDALLKAGKIAQGKGYFLYVTEVGRPMEYQVKNFCRRTAESIAAGDNPPKSGGMGLPGSSNHGLGIAADIMLKKMVDGKEKQLTAFGTICDKNSGTNQVDEAVSLGLENATILQQIMAEAGWKRLCSEMWHFDYKGVYPSDCFKCAFPPDPPHGSMKGCKPKYKPPTS
ncbi:hypothetical protein KBC54_01155 [Patescibacteria group bacterium]|nr:hypothetical protein [Patescibacteria group bacterium]